MTKVIISNNFWAQVDIHADSTLGLTFVRAYLKRLCDSNPKDDSLPVVLERVEIELAARESAKELKRCNGRSTPPSRKSKERSFLLAVPWSGAVSIDFTDSLGTLFCTQKELERFDTFSPAREIEFEINRRVIADLEEKGKGANPA